MASELEAGGEGALIKLARTSMRPRLSVAEAAVRAGVSPDTWGHVERGYRIRAKGGRVPVVTTAATLAHMAEVVGLKPADLEEVGRRDAAEVLARMTRPPTTVLPVEVDRGHMLVSIPETLSDEDRELIKRQAEEFAAHLDRVRKGDSG
ncbi:helix-turn-helix transcriptional regulator [Nonomuraea sp. NPDC050310]|uniref:helix-turn-helix domain-containing protein n=1 Tax=Nonomuraea sp. NPDC050310 TaxID=3154935 RepID=UPI0033C9D9C9